MSALRRSLLADRAGLAARHRAVVDPSWSKRLMVLAIVGAMLGLFVFGLTTLEMTWTRLIAGFGELGSIVRLMMPPEYGTTARLLMWVHALGETLAIAFLGTLLAAIIAFPLGFLAARNVIPSWIFRFSLRRFFDSVRGVDTLIWALIWINVVGLGPFAGLLAIMTADFAAFAKLFSEAIEAADKRDGEGIRSTGAGTVDEVRFGLVPQVLPVILSQVLYYFESNTRSATIIGIVGAGGIGLHLSEQIRTLEWQHVSLIVLMILVTVAVIDFLSSRLRFAIIGRRG